MTKTFILEDDVDMNILLHQMLDEEGVPNIWIFEKSRDLLKALTPEVRVVVLDWKLDEEINGLDVMRKVRDTNPHCYAIIVTGHSGLRADVYNAKADLLIEKHPYYLYELVAEIKRGIQIVLRRDNIINEMLAVNKRIDNKRARNDNDARAIN